MLRLPVPALLLIGAIALPCPAQEVLPPPAKKNKDFTKKETPAAVDPSVGIPGEVDVHFFNGSTVRMIVQSEKLEIATLYGKLSVPVRDVRGIDFGLHIPDGMGEKITAGIKGLASSSYQEREDSLKALVELGPFSYPAVFEASKERDAEVARRALEVIKKLQGKFPRSDLKSSMDDRVVTSKFTIVGQILTPTIKAKTEYFGDVELPLAKMRTLKAVGGPSIETVVSVDAMKYALAGQWLDTKFRTDGRSAIAISAKGIVDINPQDGGNYLVGPAGWAATRNGGRGGPMLVPGRKIGQVNQNSHGGMLIGKIGDDGEPFFLGENFDGVLEAEGILYLHIGPSPFGGASSGAFEVKIARKN